MSYLKRFSVNHNKDISMLIMMGIHPMKAVNVKWMKIYYRTVKGRTEKKTKVHHWVTWMKKFKILSFIQQYFLFFFTRDSFIIHVYCLTTIFMYCFTTKYDVFNNTFILDFNICKGCTWHAILNSHLKLCLNF